MNQQEIDNILEQTFADRHVSRGEKQAMVQLFADLEGKPADRAFVRNRIFYIAKNAMDGYGNKEVLDWVEGVMRALDKHLISEQTGGDISHSRFSPGDDCLNEITGLISAARNEIDICVFTITDNRISRAILAAKERGVKIRIITDNDKQFDIGSDIDELAHANIPVRVDRTSSHMHHKFAIFDQSILVTGSYNWTRSAASANQENIIVTNNDKHIDAFCREFQSLWDNL